jgi:hypothetical protein
MDWALGGGDPRRGVLDDHSFCNNGYLGMIGMASGGLLEMVSGSFMNSTRLYDGASYFGCRGFKA